MKRLKDDQGRTLESFLASYSPNDYPRPSVTADIVLLSKKENKFKVLLIKRGGHPFLDYWALPGGFAEKDETVEETAKRELAEETSVKNIVLEELGLFSTPSRDPRTWTMTDVFFSVVNADELKPKAGDDAEDTKWFDIEVKDSKKQVTINFCNGNESFKIILNKKYIKGITRNKVDFSTVINEGLAFDHGEIIAAVLTRLGFISDSC